MVYATVILHNERCRQAKQEERKQLWRTAYAKCMSSDTKVCIRAADDALAAHDEMVAAMKERFG